MDLACRCNLAEEVTVDVRRLPRVRHLALTLLAAVGIVVAAAAPSSASSSSPPTYLALGDSVPFGYYNSPFDPATQFPQLVAFYADQSKFTSYANVVAADRGLTLLNGSCPGETTGSFIDGITDVYKCEPPTGYRAFAPLHEPYLGTQLAYAESVLSNPANRVQLVTLQLGANDEFRCQLGPSCDVAAEAAVVQQRLGTILDDLRSTGYRGRIVVVDYYALNYTDPTGVQGTLVLDRAIDTAALTHHATVASGFLAFLPTALSRGGGDSIAAGLVYPGDVHPTQAGHRLLARAVELAAH
jgi:lysophospholipase L1-like esterase